VPAPTKVKGDLAEVMVAADLVRRGYKVAIPFGEDWDYDLIVCREAALEWVQVKYSRSDGEVIHVRLRSHSLTNGKVRSTKRYTADMIDWIAVYDPTSNRCYYIPSREFAEGRSAFHLRLRPPRNGQRQGIRLAEHYLDF
jgi:hypothetical protein